MRTIQKFADHPAAQCAVFCYDNGAKALISYQTLVAEIDSEGWLTIRGLYSATTRKHIGWFMREYADYNYQAAKLLYEKNWQYNIHTGEIKEREQG